MKYNQTLIDDEYESSNIDSQEELRSISGSINLNHTMYVFSYTHLSVTKYTVDFIAIDTKISRI